MLQDHLISCRVSLDELACTFNSFGLVYDHLCELHIGTRYVSEDPENHLKKLQVDNILHNQFQEIVVN